MNVDTVSPFWTIACTSPDPLRDPVVRWHLRRERTLWSHAMRMFMFWDPVPPADARAALGDELPLERLLEIGLLRRTEAGDIVSAFAMRMPAVGAATFVLSDDLAAGGDTVMGPSAASVTLARFACPIVPVRRGLDLGCGAGTLALAMAPTCERVVATDVSPRAIALARINTWLNDVDNVELRTGDLLSPVAGESFDVIASQPPFVPKPPDLPAALFLFGGPRGDEVPLQTLSETASHLAPGGLALMAVNWPIVEGEPPLLERLRARLGPSPDLTLLLLFAAGGGPADQSRLYGALHHPNGGEERDRDVMRFREHFERGKIRQIIHSYTAVRYRPGLVGWTSSVPLDKLVDAPASRDTLDVLFAQGDRTTAPGPAPLSR
ncbi:MAG TPA: methyltransferase [Polyangiaceae bacterium]